MRKLYLHIGTEKTGTTSVQHFLAKNRTILLTDYGILYPEHPLLGTNEAHWLIAGSFVEPSRCDFILQKDRSAPHEIAKALVDVYDAARPRAMVISAEHFSSRFTAQEISMLSKALEAFDVTVIVYVRRQDQMAIANFSTGLRYGRRNWFSPEEVTPSNYYFNIRRLLDEWGNGFGEDKILLRVFEKTELKSGDVVTDFLSILGVDNADGLDPVPPMNQSFTLRQALFFIGLNKRLPNLRDTRTKEEEERIWHARGIRHQLAITLDQLESFTSGPPLDSILSDEARIRMLKSFQKDNDFVARKYLGKEKLFSDILTGSEGCKGISANDWKSMSIPNQTRENFLFEVIIQQAESTQELLRKNYETQEMIALQRKENAKLQMSIDMYHEERNKPAECGESGEDPNANRLITAMGNLKGWGSRFARFFHN